MLAIKPADPGLGTALLGPIYGTSILLPLAPMEFLEDIIDSAVPPEAEAVPIDGSTLMDAISVEDVMHSTLQPQAKTDTWWLAEGF